MFIIDIFAIVFAILAIFCKSNAAARNMAAYKVSVNARTYSPALIQVYNIPPPPLGLNERKILGAVLALLHLCSLTAT